MTNPLTWPLAPSWSFPVSWIGRGLILIACLFFLASAASWFLGRSDAPATRRGTRLFAAGSVSLFVAFLLLGALFVSRQYQFAYVFGHSDNLTATAYRVAGIWSGQEGSFLLWAVCSALFGLLAMRSTGPYRRWYTIPYALFLAGLAAILSYESPFRLLDMNGPLRLPPDGNGMAPSLLNYWVTIHPPTIFLGFGSLTVLFAFAVSALLSRDRRSWVDRARPWALLSLTLLGLGLLMGGFWAYETLGWGGFWAWDPVENVSFVPWMAVIALVHGFFIQKARGRWVFANLALAGVPFLSFLYGTFLTRSGFLDQASVHSFAQMDRSALWILLGLIGITVVGFGSLWVTMLVRERRSAPPIPAASRGGLDREKAYAAGAWLLLAMGAAAGIGMSVPFIMTLTGQTLRVPDETLYHLVLGWLYVPFMILVGVAPMLSWRSLGAREILRRLSGPFGISLGLLGLVMIYLRTTVTLPEDSAILMPGGWWVATAPWILFLAWLSLFAGSVNLWRMVETFRRAAPGLGGLLTHIGVAVLMLGLVMSRGLQTKEQVAVQEGRPGIALGYFIQYVRTEGDLVDRDTKVVFRLDTPEETFEVRPGLYYRAPMAEDPQPVAWPYIERRLGYDVYFVLAPLSFEGQLELRPGETLAFGDERFTYKGMRREGQPGQTGTRFLAEVELVSLDGRFSATPSIELAGGGPRRDIVDLGPDYLIALERMDAATNNATFTVLFRRPVHPVEVYVKPLTILVWLGAGIMTIGGFWAAAYRRWSRPTEQPPSPAPREARTDEQIDAPAPVAQV